MALLFKFTEGPREVKKLAWSDTVGLKLANLGPRLCDGLSWAFLT